MADVVGVSRGYEQRRLAALDELRDAHFAVASVQAAAQRTMPPEALKAAIVSLATGETAPLDELAQSLTRAGYERCVQVEGTGQFFHSRRHPRCVSATGGAPVPRGILGR